jgi:hypothetical protein
VKTVSKPVGRYFKVAGCKRIMLSAEIKPVMAGNAVAVIASDIQAADGKCYAEEKP